MEDIFHGVWHRRYHTVRKYGLRNDDRLHYGNIPLLHKYDRCFFLGLLVDEYTLRMNVQEQERIQQRINGLCSSWGPVYQEDEEWMDAEDVEDIEINDDDSSPLLHHEGQMNSSIATSEKIPNRKVTKSHEKGIKILKQKLYDAKAQHSQLSRKLYEAETILPPTVKRVYDTIRRDAKNGTCERS